MELIRRYPYTLVEQFPYSSHYLKSLVSHQNLRYREIFKIIILMDQWANEIIGKDMFTWTYDFSIPSRSTSLIKDSTGNGYFSDFIGFVYEEDLIAFKLKFGIST